MNFSKFFYLRFKNKFLLQIKIKKYEDTACHSTITPTENIKSNLIH